MQVVLGLGTNLGNREDNLARALDALERLEGTQLLKLSNLYETEPFDVVSQQDNYLNCCVLLETSLKPETLLEHCLEIEHSLGRVRSFYGNFAVVVRALAYMLALGRQGIPEAAENAVLNANYLMHRLAGTYDMACCEAGCMHEFVMDLSRLKAETGVTAMDVAKRLLDFGIHPPTMYFPLIVHEALMAEPTETESRETLDAAADLFLQIWDEAHTDPEILHTAPHNTPIGRPDEVSAARRPVVRYAFES